MSSDHTGRIYKHKTCYHRFLSEENTKLLAGQALIPRSDTDRTARRKANDQKLKRTPYASYVQHFETMLQLWSEFGIAKSMVAQHTKSFERVGSGHSLEGGNQYSYISNRVLNMANEAHV